MTFRWGIVAVLYNIRVTSELIGYFVKEVDIKCIWCFQNVDSYITYQVNTIDI